MRAVASAGKAHRLRLCGLILDEFRPGNVPPRLHGGAPAQARVDDHLLDRGSEGKGGIDRLFDGDFLAAPVHAVRREEEARPGVGEPLGHGLVAEAREDGKGSDPHLEAGEHGQGGLGKEGHADPGGIARLHARGAHGVGEAARPGGKIRVGEAAHLAAVPLPDEGEPVFPRRLRRAGRCSCGRR